MNNRTKKRGSVYEWYLPDLELDSLVEKKTNEKEVLYIQENKRRIFLQWNEDEYGNLEKNLEYGSLILRFFMDSLKNDDQRALFELGTLKGVVFNEEYDTNDLITMLFYLGYITISHQEDETIFKIPNYVTNTVFSDYFARVLSESKQYEINTKAISSAIKELSKMGDIIPTVELVKEFLSHQSNRDLENFNEKNLKYVFTIFLELSKQYIVYGEFPAKQGFADVLVGRSSSSTAKHEAIIELKYMSKEKGKNASKEKLIEEAREQLKYYMKDKRLEQRENLKKYVIVFTGFEDYFVEEL